MANQNKKKRGFSAPVFGNGDALAIRTIIVYNFRIISVFSSEAAPARQQLATLEVIITMDKSGMRMHQTIAIIKDARGNRKEGMLASFATKIQRIGDSRCHFLYLFSLCG